MSDANNLTSTDNSTTNTQQNNNSTQDNSTKNDKQKIIIIKEGELLRYKKRLFTNNWRPAQITLYSNASFLIATRRNPSTPALIKCHKNSTLIIYGQQLDLIPKRPSPPNGHKLEHMLAIGLINQAYTYSGKVKGQIIFYWFSLSSQEELIGWVVAFQNSLFTNTPQTAKALKANPDFQVISNIIALNNAANISYLSDKMKSNPLNQNDDLSLSVLMANTTGLNTYSGGFSPGTATGMTAIGAASLLAAGAQHQAITSFNDNGQWIMGKSNRIAYPLSGTGSSYFNDDSTVNMIDPISGHISAFEAGGIGNSNYLDDAKGVPLAEIATIMNVADFADCSMDFGDCGMAADCGGVADGGGGDCGGGDWALAIF